MILRIVTLSVGALVSMLAHADDGAGMPIRVLTYNIHHGEGTDGELDLERIAEVIRAADPDVVCLQEVDYHQMRSGRVDQTKELAALLGMHTYVFESNYDFGGGGYGNATLTRFEIVEHTNLRLPNPHDVEPRGALRTTLRSGDVEFDVISTHFGLKPDERAAQADAIWSLVRDKLPTVLAGDLNEDERASGVKQLLTQFQSVHTAFAPGHDLTSPATAPARRIDFILYRGGLTLEGAEVRHEDPVKVASDHLPVLAVFRVPLPAGVNSTITKE